MNRLIINNSTNTVQTTVRKSDYFEAFFKGSNEGFCIIEVETDKRRNITNFIIREANPAFVLHTGLKYVVGKAVSEILPNFEQYWFNIYKDVYDTGLPNYLENYIKDLDSWYGIYISRIGEEKSNLIAVTYTDISRLRKAEKALEENEKHLAQMFEVLPVGVGFYDTKVIFIS